MHFPINMYIVIKLIYNFQVTAFFNIYCNFCHILLDCKILLSMSLHLPHGCINLGFYPHTIFLRKDEKHDFNSWLDNICLMLNVEHRLCKEAM